MDPVEEGEGDPEQQLKGYAERLADGVDRAIPAWVVGSVDRVMTAWSGAVPEEVQEAAIRAAEQARVEAGGAVRRLLATDVDEQVTTPLAIIRGAVRYPTEVLRAAGVPPVARDAFAERAFPDDPYDLSPASYRDVDPGLAEAGLAWGAAKAFVHKRRHGRG